MRSRRLCVVMNAAALFALLLPAAMSQIAAPADVSAADAAVTDGAALQRVSIVPHQQRSSMWGVHVNMDHKRDRLQGAAGQKK